MKIKGLFSITLFSLLFSFSYAQENIISIVGRFEGNNVPTEISYTVASNGNPFGEFKKSTKVDEKGNFEFTINLSEASFLNLEYKAKHLRPIKFENKTYKSDLLEVSNRYFVVEPSIKHYDISIQIAEQGSRLLVNNDNQKAQRFVNFLNYYPPTSLFASNHFENNVYSIKDLMIKIENAKQKELKPLQELLAEKNISQAFYDVVKADRDCYYSIIQAVTSANMMKRFKNQSNIALKNWEKSFDLIESQKDIHRSVYYFTYLKQYVKFKTLKSFEFNSNKSKETLKPLHQNGQFHAYFINEASKVLNENELEFFTASYIFEILNQDIDEALIVDLFTNFLNRYPESSYLAYISPKIDIILAINNLKLTDSKKQQLSKSQKKG